MFWSRMGEEFTLSHDGECIPSKARGDILVDDSSRPVEVNSLHHRTAVILDICSCTDHDENTLLPHFNA